ncbi:hypothetical protein D3C86_385160 [compost metagenome]
MRHAIFIVSYSQAFRVVAVGIAVVDQPDLGPTAIGDANLQPDPCRRIDRRDDIDEVAGITERPLLIDDGLPTAVGVLFVNHHGDNAADASIRRIGRRAVPTDRDARRGDA